MATIPQRSLSRPLKIASGFLPHLRSKVRGLGRLWCVGASEEHLYFTEGLGTLAQSRLTVSVLADYLSPQKGKLYLLSPSTFRDWIPGFVMEGLLKKLLRNTLRA